MSRSRISLFEVDRAALGSFSSELRRALAADDKEALVRILAVDGMQAEAVRLSRHAVFTLLSAEGQPGGVDSIFESLRHAARDRALRRTWTSESLALEGRLRGFEPLRGDAELARRADALLDGAGIPWFLRRPGGTFGSLSSVDKDALATGLLGLDDAPPELIALGEALEEFDGEALCHDTL